MKVCSAVNFRLETMAAHDEFANEQSNPCFIGLGSAGASQPSHFDIGCRAAWLVVLMMGTGMCVHIHGGSIGRLDPTLKCASAESAINNLALRRLAVPGNTHIARQLRRASLRRLFAARSRPASWQPQCGLWGLPGTCLAAGIFLLLMIAPQLDGRLLLLLLG